MKVNQTRYAQNANLYAHSGILVTAYISMPSKPVPPTWYRLNKHRPMNFVLTDIHQYAFTENTRLHANLYILCSVRSNTITVRKAKIMLKNYHTHTFRCHHAQGTDEEMVLAAIKSGIKVFGFSDHGPLPYKDFVSGMRMTIEES